MRADLERGRPAPRIVLAETVIGAAFAGEPADGIAVFEFVERLGRAVEIKAFGGIRRVVAVVEGQAAEEADVSEIARAEDVVLELGDMPPLTNSLRRQLLGEHVVEPGLRR